jgi:hypothetical protein
MNLNDVEVEIEKQRLKEESFKRRKKIIEEDSKNMLNILNEGHIQHAVELAWRVYKETGNLAAFMERGF